MYAENTRETHMRHMMNEDHDKLIAKIQHFYDIMQKDLSIVSSQLIICPDNVLDIGKEDILNNLVIDYRKIFHNFLYQE